MKRVKKKKKLKTSRKLNLLPEGSEDENEAIPIEDTSPDEKPIRRLRIDAEKIESSSKFEAAKRKSTPVISKVARARQIQASRGKSLNVASPEQDDAKRNKRETSTPNRLQMDMKPKASTRNKKRKKAEVLAEELIARKRAAHPAVNPYHPASNAEHMPVEVHPNQSNWAPDLEWKVLEQKQLTLEDLADEEAFNKKVQTHPSEITTTMQDRKEAEKAMRVIMRVPGTKRQKSNLQKMKQTPVIQKRMAAYFKKLKSWFS